MRTVNGVAFGTNGVTNSYDDSYALIKSLSGGDQTVEAVVYRDPSLGSGSVNEVELLLRFNDDTGNARGYECLFNAYGGFDILRWNGPFGDVTNMSLSYTGQGSPLVTGDVLKAMIVGNVITIYKNGTLLARASDSAIATGSPGMATYTKAGTNPALLGFTSYSATSK